MGCDKCGEVDLHLLFVHERGLKPHDLAALLLEEHIAAAEQILGAGAVEHNARVRARCDAEGDACRKVGFEGRCNDIGTGRWVNRCTLIRAMRLLADPMGAVLTRPRSASSIAYAQPILTRAYSGSSKDS